MEDKILAALLDLRISLGELRSALTDIDQAVQKLMAAQMDALAAKNTPTPPARG